MGCLCGIESVLALPSPRPDSEFLITWSLPCPDPIQPLHRGNQFQTQSLKLLPNLILLFSRILLSSPSQIWRRFRVTFMTMLSFLSCPPHLGWVLSLHSPKQLSHTRHTWLTGSHLSLNASETPMPFFPITWGTPFPPQHYFYTFSSTYSPSQHTQDPCGVKHISSLFLLWG